MRIIATYLLAFCLLLSSGCAEEFPPDPTIRGFVWSSQPVVGAKIQLFWLDEQGNPIDEVPIWNNVDDLLHDPKHRPVHSGSDGSFEIELFELPEHMFMIRAIGGTTQEYWSEEPHPLSTTEPHTRTIVTNFDPYAERPVILSPYTEMSVEMAKAIIEHDPQETLEQAISRTNDAFSRLAYVHAPQYVYSITHTPPQESNIRELMPGERYYLALQQLSSLAREWTLATSRTMTTADVLGCALEDISEDAIIDGTSSCEQWESESLRVLMVRALLRRYANPVNHDYPYSDLASFIGDALQDWNRDIFDEAPLLALDNQAPTIYVDAVRHQDDIVEIDFTVLDDVTGVHITDSDLAANGIQVYTDELLPTLIPLTFNLYRPAIPLRPWGEYSFTAKLDIDDLSENATVNIFARDQAENEADIVTVPINVNAVSISAPGNSFQEQPLSARY